MRSYQTLSRWQFVTGHSGPDWSAARTVTLPHTWNVEPGTEDLFDVGWYRCTLPACAGPRRFVRFRAACRDARVWLNGREVGRHTGSGYTPFTLELTDGWNPHGDNELTVQVSNRFSWDGLPYQESFDWANDGGLIRPVELFSTGSHRIRAFRVEANPFIPTVGQRVDGGAAGFGVRGAIDGDPADDLTLVWQVCPGPDGDRPPLARGTVACGAGDFALPGQVFPQVDFWHFDAPNLYTLTLELYRGDTCLDGVRTAFGFRELRLRGPRLYLNGEAVRLCGTEWMPGSHPDWGMAEPREQLERMLTLLKESNCVYTRFHWQQDDWVYDWCDRHGMLVQEEVPFWGPQPHVAGPTQMAAFESQIQEMVDAHGNHPSIFAWGVGNELNSQTSETIDYIKRAVALTHRLDPTRFANYVSFAMYDDPNRDGTTDGDILMMNDYMGTGHGVRDERAEWDRFTAANPDRAMTPSEFGLCEPLYEGGDTRRQQLFLEKMTMYRQYPHIVGTINFCLNDYRTHMGEEGQGKERRRVHGSTDLWGNPKPSYRVVAEECAPLAVESTEDGVRFTCRKDLPCYTVKGYVVRQGELTLPIPTLHPGESWLCTRLRGTDFQVLRPSGDRMR